MSTGEQPTRAKIAPTGTKLAPNGLVLTSQRPAVVVGCVPVEHIHLVEAHAVDGPQDPSELDKVT